MDRSLHSPLLTSSPFSPRSRQSIGSKRSGLVPASFKKSSRFSVSGKSAQSIQVILKSPYNCIERFGQPLPVLITEALTFGERNIIVSARISENGFAWIVCSRRLLVWQYRQNTALVGTPQRKQIASSQCFELQLPQSDLAHRAELVSIFIPINSSTPSCIAVSPEGVVRYWPAVTHEGISVEQVVDLQGQECDSLTDVGELGCILATTTCSVVLVQPHLSGGRHSLSCRTLRPPIGWLGGISKKMSSFIFGPMTSEHSAETRLVRVLSVHESDSTWIVYVLAGHSLQKWRMSTFESEQLIFVTDLNRFIRDSFHSTVWDSCGGDQTETDTWLLDIQSDKDNIIILAAAVNMHVSPQVRYALASIQTNTYQPPTGLKDFFVLKMTGLYREDNPADSLSYRFLLCGTSAYLYNQRSITIIKPQEEPDTLEFIGSQDVLLGGSICVNTPIFFSRNHGLVSVSGNDLIGDLNVSVLSTHTPLETSINETAAANLSVYNMDAEELLHTHKDAISQLKAAFIFYIKNQQSACQDVIHNLFLTEGQPIASIDAALDRVVIDISEELLNDIPAGDPRWTSKSQVGIGSSYSMQILHQLQDKLRAHKLYISFLHDTELWNRLSAVTIRDTVFATVYILGECAEKVTAATTLKNSGNNTYLEKAIDKLINISDVPMENGLTKQDVLYREVTRIHRVLQELVSICEEIVRSDQNPSETVTLIKSTNDLLLTVLKEVLQYRQQNIDNFSPHPNALSLAPDYLPWTSAPGSQGLYNALMQQQILTCNYGARMATDNSTRNILYDQLVSLVDILLDGMKSHLESIKRSSREEVLFKQYQVDRHKLIAPLVLDNEWERAAQLAEKYLDFETLIIICESTNNQQRLDEYMERFSTEGFSEFVYNWYLQENKPAKLINRCRMTSQPKHSQKLTSFLAEHPSLSWMQNIFERKFGNAAKTLKDLAIKEQELVTRQKTMLSLSKLAKLAAQESPDAVGFIEEIDSRLELIAFQEDVPDYVLQHFGYDTVKLKVIPPKDLIHLYTCIEYKEANEAEFKKALDLLEYIDDVEIKNELALNIWKTAILRDSWLEGNIDSPMEILENTLFFKLADLSLCLGANPHTLLPSLDSLMEALELQELQESKNFQYLLKTAYEHVQKWQAVNE